MTEDLQSLAKRMTRALISVRPLGGSELFIMRNGECYADPEYCGRLIQEQREALHEARVDAVLLQRKHRALLAAAERVCGFDWPDSDDDAAASIDALRAAVNADT